MSAIRLCGMWHFIRRLKNEELGINRTLRQAQAGIQPTMRRHKWRQLEDRINHLKQQHTDGTITLTEYWNAIWFVIVSH